MTAPAEQAASARTLHKRVPDFFIAGHTKSGTTALWDMLKRHPQIHMPRKEPWFFADEVHPPAAPRPVGTGKTPKTLEEYLSLFDSATPEQRIGEASCLYLWSHTAARNIADVQPDARIIAVLREPASFLRSLHYQFVQVTSSPRATCAARSSSRRTGGRAGTSPATPTGRMPPCTPSMSATSSSCSRYHALFGPEQVLVLIYDDFRRDNEATVRRVWRFLDVDDTLAVKVRDANPTVRVRSRRLYSLMHSVAAGEGALPRAVQATARRLAPPQLSRQSAIAIRDRIFYATPPPPEASLMGELRSRFKGEVVALSEYLGRDFVDLWGYDSVE